MISEKGQKRKDLQGADITPYSSDIEKFHRSMELENLRPSTLTSYLSYLKIFAAWLVLYCGGLGFYAVTVDVVRNFLEFLKVDLALAPNTINGYLAAVRKMFQYLRDEELSKRAVPDLAVDQHMPKVPSTKQVLAMLRACVSTKELLFVGLLITTGVRLKELLCLKFSDIRKDTAQIYISSEAKGRADGFVPLSKNIVRLLTLYCREYNSRHPGNPLKPDDYIFFSIDRSSHESDYQMRRCFINIQKRAGLETEGFRPHAMRHFFALRIYMQSHDLFLVKSLLRHKTLAATLKYLVMASSIDVQKQYDNPGDIAFRDMGPNEWNRESGDENEEANR